MNKKQIILSLVAGWVCALGLPICAGLFSNRPIVNSACIIIGQSVSVIFSIIYILLNILIFCVLTVTYSMIIHKLRLSDQLQKTGRSNKSAIVRLGLIVMTNLFASMTLNMLGILSLAHVYVSPTVESLLSFVIFPLNACINPIINNLTTWECMDQYVDVGMLMKYAKLGVSKCLQFFGLDIFIHILVRIIHPTE